MACFADRKALLVALDGKLAAQFTAWAWARAAAAAALTVRRVNLIKLILYSIGSRIVIKSTCVSAETSTPVSYLAPEIAARYDEPKAKVFLTTI